MLQDIEFLILVQTNLLYEFFAYLIHLSGA